MSNKKKVKATLFNPDVFATALHSAIISDLKPAKCQAELDEKQLASSLFSFFQCDQFLKKYKMTDSRVDTTQVATDTLLNNISRLSTLSVNFPTDKSPFECNSIELALLRARQFCHHILTPFLLEELFDECKNSTGKTIGLKYILTNDEDKWRFPISGTFGCKRLFDVYRTYDPQLNEFVCNLNMSSAKPFYSIVDASETTFVDKNDKTDRTIAIEPTLNMFFQKGAEALLRDRLSPYLDLTSLQDKHKILALESSLTQKFATIDFSSASDCVSRDLIRFLVPHEWFVLLDTVRCRNTFVNKVLVSDLPMISTMGNATTFPLETLVFFALAHAVVSPFEGRSLIAECDINMISIYGDDCILPTSNAAAFIELCSYVGFLVNKEKSFFSKEYFRESCGADCFDYRNVRPFHLKRPTHLNKNGQEAWMYSILNGLIKKYITYFGSLSYCYTLSFLHIIDKWFVENGAMVCVVPDDFPDDAGLKVYGDFLRLRPLFKAKFRKVLVDCNGSVHNLTSMKFVSHHEILAVGERDKAFSYHRSLKFGRARESAYINKQKGVYEVVRSRRIVYFPLDQ